MDVAHLLFIFALLLIIKSKRRLLWTIIAFTIAHSITLAAARWPWFIAFIFGLLHGFAGALAEVSLPQQAIPLALVFFNIGVELGQLLFVATMVLIGWALHKIKK